ncbi:GNAT family N-acetyltransferase [Cellulophaga lytica]|uniref:GNAT family N-acetyltransferase n=1 Tax=Cellulophaga lytica TaxID=979 RepID=UPI0032E516F4
MITYIKWDSEFFGYNIGNCVIADYNNFNFSEFKVKSNKFKLVYLFSKEPLNHKELKLVDIKVTFKKATSILDESNEVNNINLFSNNNDDFSTLEKLALTSGEYSRFRIDENFKNNEFEALYKKWIRSFVYNKDNVDVIIYKEQRRILGFTTLEGVNENLCDIGLVAVNQNERGKKIGTKLINFTLNKAFEKGFKEVKVVTQFDNKPAINLYEKCGFKRSKLKYIYHYWNL